VQQARDRRPARVLVRSDRIPSSIHSCALTPCAAHSLPRARSVRARPRRRQHRRASGRRRARGRALARHGPMGWRHSHAVALTRLRAITRSARAARYHRGSIVSRWRGSETRTALSMVARTSNAAMRHESRASVQRHPGDEAARRPRPSARCAPRAPAARAVQRAVSCSTTAARLGGHPPPPPPHRMPANARAACARYARR